MTLGQPDNVISPSHSWYDHWCHKTHEPVGAGAPICEGMISSRWFNKHTLKRQQQSYGAGPQGLHWHPMGTRMPCRQNSNLQLVHNCA